MARRSRPAPDVARWLLDARDVNRDDVDRNMTCSMAKDRDVTRDVTQRPTRWPMIETDLRLSIDYLPQSRRLTIVLPVGTLTCKEL